MLNKLQAFLREYAMLTPGDTLVCAVSGGADSMALLWGMYLLRERLGIRVEAAHYNHNLRGKESLRDEDFVREFCQRYDIPLHIGSGRVVSGKRGLEAAAREARYAFFATLPGKVATAHTADDNTETLFLHLLRGTGLKGLGGIAPIRGKIIRPMLSITRQDVLNFLEQQHLSWVEDASNHSDAYLRNRLRRHVIPLLTQENPRFAENLSATALRLREDEAFLDSLVSPVKVLEISPLLALPPALQSRAIAGFFAANGIPDIQAEHIALTLKVARSENPSAAADLPWGNRLYREYGKLFIREEAIPLAHTPLPCPGCVELTALGVRITATQQTLPENAYDYFTVQPVGEMVVRRRLPGDEITLSGGTKSLKKLYIDRKIPARQRPLIPVIADDQGVLGVYGIGANLARAGGGVTIQFEKVHSSETL